MKFSRLFSRPLIVVFALGLTLPSASFAALSANLPLSGTVNANNSLSITTNGTNNQSLNITAGNTSGLNVATATETSNDAGGYSISVTSANNGELELGGTSTTQETAYQISYDGGGYLSPTNGAQTIKTVKSLTGLTTHPSPILVTVTAYPNAVAGTYSDTLTFSIIAN